MGTTRFEDDPKVQEAMRFISPTCNQMLAIGSGYCGKTVSVGIVDRPNLLCDRFLVGKCEDGHEQSAAVIDD